MFLSLSLAPHVTHYRNLKVIITYVSDVRSQHLFGLRMNGMHKGQFDHAGFNLLLIPFVI